MNNTTSYLTTVPKRMCLLRIRRVLCTIWAQYAYDYWDVAVSRNEVWRKQHAEKILAKSLAKKYQPKRVG